ncbi:6,7-dimethyl-8-ribityllumazine synthase [Pisolithus thermaeus]|nr:6,7-dimethyl-8-ribityllumazine synthase [Pisolithus thermaeus]
MTSTMSSIKGPSANEYDGSNLRIAIVHARWNKSVIDALVAGALNKLRQCGVKAHNIVIQSVPGSFELPLACSRIIAGSRTQNGGSTGDLLGFTSANTPGSVGDSPTVSAPFDAVIAIGVLIKGATMHFEYICDSVSHALMRTQLDTGVPIIFGVLTALNEEQALERAGMGSGLHKGHNHGEDWGLAAVEMATHCRNWAQGKFMEEVP